MAALLLEAAGRKAVGKPSGPICQKIMRLPLGHLAVWRMNKEWKPFLRRPILCLKNTETQKLTVVFKLALV